MELIQGFRWPLLKEFSPAVNFCRFEQGDVIYDDPQAYSLVWNEALQRLAISLLINASEKGKGTAGDEESVFEANWASSITVEITDYKTNSPKTTVECKQGNLYTALWQGDLSHLRTGRLPVAPRRWNDLVKWLRDENGGTSSFHPLNKLIADLDCAHVFVLPGDNVSPITSQKLARLRKELSANFGFQTREIRITEIPDPTFQQYAPTTVFYLFGVNDSPIGWSRGRFLDALKRVLYKLDLNKKTREQFSLSKHGVLIDKKPFTEGICQSLLLSPRKSLPPSIQSCEVRSSRSFARRLHSIDLYGLS